MRKLHVAELCSIRAYLVGASVLALMAGGATAASADCTGAFVVDCTGATTGPVNYGGILTNSGTITATGGPAVNIYNGVLNNLAGGVITGTGDAIENANSGVLITNAGTINGNVNLALSSYISGGSVFVDDGGTINGSLLFGPGSQTYVTNVSTYANGRFTNISGTLSGGGYASTLILQTASNYSGTIASAPNFERTEYDLSNGAAVTLSSPTTVTNTLVLAGTGSVNLTANLNVANQVGITVGTPYGVSYSTPETLSIVSHGNMVFSENNGDPYIGVALQNNTSFENAGNITVSSTVINIPSPAAINGGAFVTNSGTITVTDAAAVENALKVVNTGSILQGANPQTGFGHFSYGLYGVNTVENSGTIATDGTAITLYFVNNYVYNLNAPGASVVNSGLIHSANGDAIDEYYSSGPVTVSNAATGQIISDKGYAIYAGGFDTTVQNAGVISGNISLMNGNDLIENSGTITGNINLAYGNDTLRLTGGSFTGTATAYGGYDRLDLAPTNASTPLALGTASFNGFQELDMEQGAATLGGTYSFGTVNVSGGTLFGLAGSSLAAPVISVAQGAVFGAAGTVTGTITVNGTLVAGGVGGTMAVKGNVGLTKGATASFDLTPMAAYKLQTTGTVTIADGATLQLTGATKLTPGQKLNLIQAGGGITGQFSTVSGGPTGLHLIQSANSLQGLELFTTNTAFSRQVSNTVGILNTALINGQASDALIAAMPALVDANTGESDPNALLRLTPQAYASASQLATEDALSVIGALRDEAHFADGPAGGFAFGVAVDGARKEAGNAADGVVDGRLTDSGVLSGMGYGGKSAWIAGFGGYLDGVERLSALNARTTTHSLVLGAQGQVRTGGFRLGLLAAYDRGNANTRRAAPGEGVADGRYGLKSWIGNIDVAYRAPVNADWTVEPRLAATYVRTTRDSAAEQGGGALALTVDGGRSANWYVDGHVELDGGQAAGRTVHPFVSVASSRGPAAR